MAIKMTCECGKTLTVPDDAAGRRARCPACNVVVQVPGTPPPPPPPPPDAPPQQTKVDAMMETFVADLAKSRERAPQLTQIATTQLVWAGIAFAMTFLASLGIGDYNGSVIYWIIVYVPISAAGALLALGIIKAWEHTPDCMEVASLLIVGASYALFWESASAVSTWRSLFLLFVNLVNMAGYVFLYWYFKWHGIAAIFKPEPEGASPSPAKTPMPSEGTDKK